MTKDQKPGGFAVDMQSPYYLHPSDSPGALITAIKFDGKNYDLWEQAMRTALTAKNKLGFIKGKIEKPMVTDKEGSAEANEWDIVNSMITSWIMNVIDPRLHSSLAYIDTAQKLWENIKKRYSVPDVPRMHHLKVEIASCKQGIKT